VDDDFVRGLGILGSCGNIAAGNRGDARKGLPPEAKARDAVQVVLGFYLGCGVGQAAQPQILFRHSAAAVHNADAPNAAFLDIGLYFGASRVNGVVKKLPDNRSGPVDNLARGDSPGNRVAKHLHGPARGILLRHGRIISAAAPDVYPYQSRQISMAHFFACGQAKKPGFPGVPPFAFASQTAPGRFAPLQSLAPHGRTGNWNPQPKSAAALAFFGKPCYKTGMLGMRRHTERFSAPRNVKRNVMRN
jgi:hypothetical protein